MRTGMWLRIAAGLTLFLAAGHTVGAVLAAPSHGAGEVAVREAMRTFTVVEMGIERSYWDLYFGSGWTITVLLLAAAGVMWFLAPLARQAPNQVWAAIMIFAVAFGAVTVISMLYFVTAPIVVSAAITICLLIAAFGKKG